MKRVEVVWSDAAHHAPGEWTTIPTDPSATVRTVGYLLDKTKTHLTLAQSKSDDYFTGVFTIPRTAVRKVTVL